MIWFEDFEKKFSSLLEEFNLSQEQQNNLNLQSDGNCSINQGFKNENICLDSNKIQDQYQQNEMSLENIDFYELYDDEDFKKLLKQNSKIQFDSLTVQKNPIFCFFVRILQIVQQSIEESHHLKSWGILNNLLDYINIERSVLVYILIGVQQQKVGFDLSKALLRLYRILQGIKGLRQRVLKDIDTKSFQDRKYNQNPSLHTNTQLRSPNIYMLSQKNSQKKQSNANHYFSPQQIKDKITTNSTTGFRLDQTGRWQMHNEQNENQNEGEVRINMPSVEQENKQNERIHNQNFNSYVRPKKKSCLVYDTAFIQNAIQNERKNSSALNSQTSSPISPISPIFTECEKEFLIVSYEIFFYTHKYSQFFLFDIVKQADENNLVNKNRLNQIKEDIIGGQSSLNENTTNINNQQCQNEKILLQQIYEIAASYLQEQQQQYLIPRQKISSLDLDMNDSQTQSTFTQKLSDGFKSTQSYSSGSFSISYPFQSFQLSLNNNSGGIGNSYSNNEISLCSFQNENSMEKSSNGLQDEIVNQNNSQDNQQIAKSNQNSVINNSMLVPSSSTNSKNTNFVKKTKSLEKQLIGSGSTYLKSLKQACKEQDDYVNSYLKMLLYRQRQNIVKQDVTPKSMPRLQVSNQRIMVSAKSLTFGEASASFQNQDYNSCYSNEEPNTKSQANVFSQKFNENNNQFQGFHRQNSRSSSGGSNNNHHNEMCQYESNTSINEQDFEDDDDSIERNFEEQNQISHSDELDIGANSQMSHNSSLKQLNLNQHHHYNHLFHHHHHHHQPHTSKSLKQIKYNLNPDWTRSLSQTQIKKKSQNFVSLMQEVKEEREDSELFNSILLDRKKRREKSTSAQQNFSDSQKSLEKDKLGVFNQNSLDTQKSITILRCSASSTKSAAKNDIKICNTSLDSAPNGNQNGRFSQSPSSNNIEMLFPRFSQNTHESLVINEQVEIQPRKVESEDEQQNLESETNRSSNQNEDHQRGNEKAQNENPKISQQQVQSQNTQINQEYMKIETPPIIEQKKTINKNNISKQKESSEDESSNSSSSSYSSDSSESSNSNTSQQNKHTPQKKISSESAKREKSQTADSKNNKEQLSESIIKYQNKFTKQGKKSKSKLKKSSRKHRKDSEKQNSEKSRNDSNSASQSSGKMNRTFDTENSSSAASSIIRGKKSFDQDYQLNQNLDLNLVNNKNLQRRGGIQVRTALKHLTKRGREFDTLGVVKPNFNLINEINFNYESPQESSFNKKGSFEIKQQSNKNITLTIPNTLNQSQSLSIIPPINLIKSPLPSKETSNQFSFMNESILDTNQSMAQSIDKKIYNRQSSQESDTNKNQQIKQKKKNSFFSKILKFFQKNDKDDSNKYSTPSQQKELNYDSGYIPPSMDMTKNKYLKRGFQLNGMTFYKIKDVLSYEKSRGKAALKSSSMDMEQSYIMNNSTIMISPSTSKQNFKSNQTMNNSNSIYFANTEQIIKNSIQKNNSKNQLLSPIVFSDHFQNQYNQPDTPLSNISSSGVEYNQKDEEQFEKELQELFERSSNQADYDLQDRKNNLINLYGKNSNLRQLAKKSSLNYKELSIIVDEEMSNENSLANRLAHNNLKKGCNLKKELIKKEINEEQLFTYPRESVNFLTYQKEQQRIQKKIKMQSAKNCLEFQIIFNQTSNWTKLKLKVKKAFQLYRIYLENKQFYPDKKELKDFFSIQQQLIYQKQIIKDLERKQEQAVNEKQQEDFDPFNYIQPSRLKIIQNSRQAKQLTDDTFNFPF
ncbi:hypothetical protein ABPG74_007012 [Tetrahymena malaccensis]